MNMEQAGQDIGKPEILYEAEPWWRGFSELQASRTIGGMGGVSGIPYTEKAAWLERNGYSNLNSFTRGMSLLTYLDNLYLEHKAKEAEARSKKRR
jgi:hypothetical protein